MGFGKCYRGDSLFIIMQNPGVGMVFENNSGKCDRGMTLFLVVDSLCMLDAVYQRKLIFLITMSFFFYQHHNLGSYN